MPKHKIRQSILAKGGFTSGGNFLFGSASMNSPSAVADSVVVGASIAVAGVGAGDTISSPSNFAAFNAFSAFASVVFNALASSFIS